MRAKLFTIFALLCMSVALFGQEEAQWEPQTNITGYGALEWNYFEDLKLFDRKYAAGLTEAGILASYKPFEKFTIKTVFVYRPEFSIDQMLNEINGEYKFNDLLVAKAGRFLTPLSPMNTYYYSPVNNSATLPMLIQNHEFFPLNMDGIAVSGGIGENFKINYNVFAGGFRNALWLKTGALGLFGQENDYFQRVIKVDNSSQGTSTFNSVIQFGEGAHVDLSFKDYVNIGFGIFSDRETVVNENKDQNGATVINRVPTKKLSYGANIKIKYSTVQLLGEYWDTKTKFTIDMLGDMEMEYKGSFAELSSTMGKFTPYGRIEYHEVPVFSPVVFTNPTKYYRYTGGINYKPIFDITLKLEYMYYKYSAYTLDNITFIQTKHNLDLNGFVATIIYRF